MTTRQFDGRQASHAAVRAQDSRGVGRRALLHAALASVAAGAGAAFLGDKSANAAHGGAMLIGEANDAEGWATSLTSAFHTGKNFTVETVTSGSQPIVTSIVGIVSAREASNGYATGVRGEVDGGLSSNGTGVVGTAKSSDGNVMGVQGIGLATNGDGIGVSGNGSAIGVRGTSKDGVGLLGSDSLVALRAEGKSEFAGDATFGGKIVASGPASGFTGDGSGLSNLNAASIAAGTLSDARLSANVPRMNSASNSFSGILRARALGGAGGGPPRFVGAGKGAIPKGADRVTVTAPLVKPASSVFVVFRSDPGSRSIRWVKTGAGKFDVILTGPVDSKTAFAYFALG
jgi:hypothetical protein